MFASPVIGGVVEVDAMIDEVLAWRRTT